MTTDFDIDTTREGLDPNVCAPPKKRRRRTAATGASEDCFTCRKRQTKCDRRRPYCGQCLEIGKDCSGYKTTLTWNVGVASRGKLRGLSCPVARQPGEEAVETKKTTPAQKRKASTTKSSKTSKEAIFKSACTADFSSTPTPVHGGKPGIKAEPAAEPSHGFSLPIPIQSGWRYSEQSPSSLSHPIMQRSIPHSHGSSLDSDTGLHLYTSLSHSLDSNGFPLSASSMSTFSDAGYTSPGDFPPSPLPLQYADSYPPFFSNPFAVPEGQESEHSVDSASSFFDGADHMQSLDFTSCQFPQQEIDVNAQYASEFETMAELDMAVRNMEPQPLAKDIIDFGFTLPRSLFHSQFFHLSTRMQYLLDYYNHHICSVLVASDSAVNPYRQHVLALATHNEGLQNAIAALAINNIRMRSLDRGNTVGYAENLGDNSSPSPEELSYKSISINQLQMQLADPRIAQDDSILGTLLILCLFHVCDSGFSKFKTQLEGVQKLLSMRDPSQRTGFIGWVEMFFTWFDVMTSTVNDRETEIRGDSLEMMEYSSNLGAMEQYSGCDGRLFKLIARLGRMNLLSQNRPVRREQDTEETPRQSYLDQAGPLYEPMGPRIWHKPRATDVTDFTRLDENGRESPIVTSDEEDTPIKNERSGSADSRHEFWREWSDVRARLHSWSMKPSKTASPQQVTGDDMELPMGIDERDMLHINESFRSSALLYTERLAHPHLPSSSPNLQHFVCDALSHITAISITSCVNKFLLWPLFIAGTECVDAHHRAIVRDRCLEIMRESGFYNNLSVLEVLERVWLEQGEDSLGGDIEEIRQRRNDSTDGHGGFGQPFRWRKAMDRVDGEYIVV